MPKTAVAPRWGSLLLLLLNEICQTHSQVEVFTAELFLDNNDLNAGLYEGEVKGRRRFGDSQVPHGIGTIYYFTNDKFNRVNYTGEWVDGQREGNGSTFFQDGAHYIGGYVEGLESGAGMLLYPNGNSLDAEFVKGKIQGHGVFRYANGDQREGFFTDSSLEGQVIFTRGDGVTFIEEWEGGEQVGGEGTSDPPTGKERSTERGVSRRRRPSSTSSMTEKEKAPTLTSPPPRLRSSTLTTPSVDRRPRGRGGGISWSIPADGGEGGKRESTVVERLGQRRDSDDVRRMQEEAGRVSEEARSSARRFLFHIFSTVNSSQ